MDSFGKLSFVFVFLGIVFKCVYSLSNCFPWQLIWRLSSIDLSNISLAMLSLSGLWLANAGLKWLQSEQTIYTVTKWTNMMGWYDYSLYLFLCLILSFANYTTTNMRCSWFISLILYHKTIRLNYKTCKPLDICHSE